MKIRNGFVSNSSSTSFTITNKSDTMKTLYDFVLENPQLLDYYEERYDFMKGRYTHEQMLQDAQNYNVEFPPHEIVHCVFGDEDGSAIGAVYDYILRDGGESESFVWDFYEWRR